ITVKPVSRNVVAETPINIDGISSNQITRPPLTANAENRTERNYALPDHSLGSLTGQIAKAAILPHETTEKQAESVDAQTIIQDAERLQTDFNQAMNFFKNRGVDEQEFDIKIKKIDENRGLPYGTFKASFSASRLSNRSSLMQ